MHYSGPERGGGVALNFTEFAVVNAHGVLLLLDVKKMEPSAKRIVQGRRGFIQVKKSLSKCFGYQNGKQSGATMPF